MVNPLLDPLHHPPRLEPDLVAAILCPGRIPRFAQPERRIKLARAPRVHELEASGVPLTGVAAVVVRPGGVVDEEFADEVRDDDGFGAGLIEGGLVVPVVAAGGGHNGGDHGVIELFH
ncbi:hypothetical protein V493_06346 [Pseudogymnoascus sp. VKM F-4281 (FW-2241)]|nr:hypothetical protein V493_06346 [Pseudogymnoascus sp. VKM F-4281 (FW-2241)]